MIKSEVQSYRGAAINNVLASNKPPVAQLHNSKVPGIDSQVLRQPQIKASDGDQTVGQYSVLTKVGQGGFGIIYRVRSLSKYIVLLL